MKKGKYDAGVIEKLIDIVRQHPVLYDAADDNYSNQDIKNNIWESIQKKMNMANVTAKQWKKEWSGKRDAYVKKRKEYRTQKSGQKAKIVKTWQFFHMMTFLDPFLGTRRTEGNLAPPTQSSGEDSVTEGEGDTDSQHGGDDNNGEKNRDNSRDNEDASNSLQDAESVAASIPTTDSIMSDARSAISSAKRRQRTFHPYGRGKRTTEKCDATEAGILQLLKENRAKQSQQQQYPYEQEDQPFFDDCARRMGKLPKSTKSVLRVQIQQLFHNAENPGDQMPVIPLLSQPVFLPQLASRQRQASSTMTTMQSPMQGPMQSPMQGPMQGPMQSPMQGPMQDSHMLGAAMRASDLSADVYFQ